MLEQVKSADLSYDEQGNLTEGVDENGALDPAAAKYVRCNTWYGSNAPEAVEMVSMVIFTGEKTSVPLSITLRNRGMGSKPKVTTTPNAIYPTT